MTFQLAVTNEGGIDADTVDVVVTHVNLAPTANDGPDQQIESTGVETSVTLDGSGSSDPEDDVLSFNRDGPSGFARGITTSGTLLTPVLADSSIGYNY